MIVKVDLKKNIIVGISDRKEEKVNKLEEKNCKNEFGRLWRFYLGFIFDKC